MANLSLWAIPLATALILLTFLSLTVNNWSPHICNTILTEEDSLRQIFRPMISQEDLQNLRKHQPNSVSHLSQKNIFGAATCQEDIQHINEILNTNIKATSSSVLSEILYKSVTRPVQGKVHGKHDNTSQI